MLAPTIYIRHINLAYGPIPLFNDFNLTLAAGKLTCLLGTSGVGKSTLLRMIANLIPYQGEISCDNGLPLHQQISYMAQTDSLMPWLTALDNALLSSKLRGKKTPQIINEAKNLLIKVGLEDALYKYPRELSGGMRQRVALVRTLLQEKTIVLMDEPFSSLDSITRFQLQTLAADFLKNRTVLFITHDPLEAVRLADEIYILSGQPAKLSTPIRLLTSTPRHPSEREVLDNQAHLFHVLLQATELHA